MKHALLAALLTLGACADAGSALPPNLRCEQDRDCTSDLVCSFNHCVVPEANRLTLAARIIPPPTSGLLPQQIPALTLDEGPDRLVQLLAPTVVRGVVKQAGNALVGNLEGEIEVRTDGDIDGLDFVFSAQSLAGVDVEGYGFELSLLPGRPYTGTFRPTDSTLPRHFFTLKPDDIAKGRFDIKLPAMNAEQAPEGEGHYLEIDGRVMQSDYTAIIGARVVVMSENREIAATTTSDSPRGMWSVLVPPGLTKFLIQVSSAADATDVFPEFTIGPLTFDPTPGWQVDVIVPDLAPGTEAITATLQVNERKVGADGTETVSPAIGRAVTVIGDLAGGTLRRSGITNELGQVTFNALPGAYECLVASPPQSSAATWRGFVNFVGAAAGLVSEVATIELAPRAPFIGYITDAFGMPVEAGTLTLQRRVDYDSAANLFIAPAPFTAELGPDGVFVTAVDPGTYDLVVTPDPSTGAPNTFETDIVVGPEGLRFDLGLPPPGLLHLTVARPDGTWIAGAQVELWVDDDLGSPRLLAVSATTEDGFVDLIVPHLNDSGAPLVE